jgi:hypothetical protein
MRIWSLIFYICLPLFSRAQSFITPIADRYQYAAALFDFGKDHHVLSRHAAGGTQALALLAAVYGENSFIPGGKKYVSFLSRLPVSPGSINFLVDYAAAGDYSEMQAGIGYSRNLGQLVQLGVRFNYYRLQIIGYGAAAAFPVEAGAIFQLYPKLRTSIHVYNLMASRPKGEGLSRIPLVVRFAMGCQASESVGISMEIMKESGKPVSFQPILFYQAAEKLFFRGGFDTNNRLVFFSGGYKQGQLRLDLSTSYMGSLGWSTGLGLQFFLPVNKQP